MLIEKLPELIDQEHCKRAQYSNPIGTPNRHRILTLRFKRSPNEDTKENSRIMSKNKAAEKAVEKKAEKKTEKVAQPEMIGVKQVADSLGLEPKALRVILRSLPKYKTNEEENNRYQWKPGDPFLDKLPKIVKEYQDAHTREKKEKDDKKAETKKSEKPAEKKADKKADKPAKKKGKSAPPPPDEDEDESAVSEEDEGEELD